MAYIPSHQELKDHPKTRRAARRAGVSLPTMIGHLHLLWWWALDHSPHGDLSRFDDEDLADGAMWEGDPETFVEALQECGPGDTEGFLTDGRQLHDWDEYGGKYAQRVEAARKAAEARWHPNGNANASPPAEQPHSNGNAGASQGASDPDDTGNAEKSRGEKRSSSPPSGARTRGCRLPDDWRPEPEPELVEAVGGQDAARREFAKFGDYWRAQSGQRARKVDWQATWRNWLRKAAEGRPGGARASPATADTPKFAETRRLQ